MVLNFQKKEQVIFEVGRVLKRSLSAVVASLEGMTANELTDLRAVCRKKNVDIYVVRNTLMCRALEGTVFQCLDPLLVGSNVIAFSTVDVSDCARIFVEFSKIHHAKFRIKGAAFDGVFIEESKIDVLSSLPTRKDCMRRMAFILKESAIGRLVSCLRILCSSQE